MKRFFFVFVMAAFYSCDVFSQGCLPQGITFTSQTQVDSFQINYPGCSHIEGDVIIGFDDKLCDITDLKGLSVLTSIGGQLFIQNTDLDSLTGLENLSTVSGRCLALRLNQSLTSLAGLNSLTSIKGDLVIEFNYSLINLSGLGNLASVGNDLIIQVNYNLIKLTGLENLTSIGRTLIIKDNGFTNLQGLSSLDSIGSYIGIESCHALTSLSGMIKLKSIQSYIVIANNNSLVNLSGLETLTSIGGLVIAENSTMSSLKGIDNVVSLRQLVIYGNTALTSLSGPENVTSLGESLRIFDNDALTDLTGLEKLTSIGTYLEILNNDALSSLSGLANLKSIGGYLNIGNNIALISLSGLDNINGASITNLTFTNNYSLATCDVKSVCDYLASPNGIIDIHDNAVGCNSQTEVEDACNILSVNKLNPTDLFKLYPNPSSNLLTIETSESLANSYLSIISLNGQQLINRHITEPYTPIDISKLVNGVYFVRLIGDKSVAVSKIVKN